METICSSILIDLSIFSHIVCLLATYTQGLYVGPFKVCGAKCYSTVGSLTHCCNGTIRNLKLNHPMKSVVEGLYTISPNCYVAVDLSIKRTIKSNIFAVVKAPMNPTRSSAVTTKPSTDPRRTLDTVAVVRKPTLATHMSVVLEKSRIETGEASCRAVETSRMMTSPICAAPVK